MRTFVYLILAGFFLATGLSISAVDTRKQLPAGKPISYYGSPGLESCSIQCGISVLIMDALSRGIKNYINDNNKFPDGDLSKITSTLNSNSMLNVDGFGQQNKTNHSVFFDDKGRFIDGWGSQFTLQRDPNGKAITIISSGPNRKLDQTEADKENHIGDDIYVVIELNQ